MIPRWLSRLTLVLCLVLGLSAPAGASVLSLIQNGGFEADLTGWTTADEIGSDGSFFVQTGTLSPLNGLLVAAPPGGLKAAMSDAGGPGSHVLYQDFTVPLGTTAGVVSFDLFINNGAELFATPNPNNLSFAATNRAGGLNLNQQVRVDILTAASDPFSVAASDVLLNLYQSNPGDPLISGYNTYVFDVSALFLARQGQVLRLRFAEVDNLSFLNVGVDNVRVDAVPEPASLLSLVVGGLCAAGIAVWRRRYALSSASGWG